MFFLALPVEVFVVVFSASEWSKSRWPCLLLAHSNIEDLSLFLDYFALYSNLKFHTILMIGLVSPCTAILRASWAPTWRGISFSSKKLLVTLGCTWFCKPQQLHSQTVYWSETILFPLLFAFLLLINSFPVQENISAEISS